MTTDRNLPPLKDWIHQIEFLTSAAKHGDLPGFGAGEIAVAGRSNAGKSSALNLICNRRKLAFSSKTPGRTQLMNYFTLAWQNEELGRLVDLPGYGYAAVEKTTKRRWQAELSQFLESRLSLVALILVMDIRHPFGPLDTQMLDWFGKRRQPIHILLTKADKLNRNDQAKALANAKRLIAEKGDRWGGNVSCSLFSALSRTGREVVVDKIAIWWGLSQEEASHQNLPQSAEDAPGNAPDKKNPASVSPGGNA
jgi:GTP-binding protein